MPAPPNKLGWPINFLTEWWTVPCGVPLIVYFELLFHATGKVVLSLLLFGMDDVVRGFFRPQRLRRWRHGRKGKKGHFQKALIPETGEIVAKWIPGVEAVAGRFVEDGVRWLWVLDAELQRVAYFLMVFDIIDEFWTELNSGIIQSKQANCDEAARLMQHGEPNITGVNGWFVLDCDVVDYIHGISSTQFDCQVPEGQFMAVLSANILNQAAAAADMTCGVRIRAENGPIQKTDTGSIATIAVGETHSSIASLKFNGPALVHWEGYKMHGEAKFKDCTINVFQIGDPQ